MAGSLFYGRISMERTMSDEHTHAHARCKLRFVCEDTTDFELVFGFVIDFVAILLRPSDGNKVRRIDDARVRTYYRYMSLSLANCVSLSP